MQRAALLGLIVLTGCQHTHLRHNTVHQAKTLSDVYEQQVLDNLARTVHDAYAIPSFAYPKDGTTNIKDTGSFSASPLRNFSDVLGIDGNRSGLEQWGLTPISEPDKLQLMQCAYQRAVYGSPLDACAKCCEKENRFEGRRETKLKVGEQHEGKIVPICNPKTGDDYEIVKGQFGLVYTHSDGKPYSVDEKGYVTLTTADCNGACTIQSGWLCHGDRCDVPRDCCGLVGFHCGTYVWVEKCHRQHLSRLTLKILDYAVNDAPTYLAREKEVKFDIDAAGAITNKESMKVGTVTAVIGIDDPVSSIITVDKCTKQILEAESEEEQGDESPDMKPVVEGSIFGVVPFNMSMDASSASGWSSPRGSASVAPLPNLTPATPSKRLIPKRRTIRPGDYGLTPYDIQRSQRGLRDE